MRTMVLAGLAAGMALAASCPAQADYVWSFKGNDTGGIISTSLIGTADVDQMATDHCARYGKVPKKLGAPRDYGLYLSFACVWVPAASDRHSLRVRY